MVFSKYQCYGQLVCNFRNASRNPFGNIEYSVPLGIANPDPSTFFGNVQLEIVKQ